MREPDGDDIDVSGTIRDVHALAQGLGRDIHESANRALGGTPSAPVAVVTLMLAEKARRILDAVGTWPKGALTIRSALARSALEISIDTQYLNADTTRRWDGRDVPLDVAYKAELFMTHHVILGARLFPDRVDPGSWRRCIAFGQAAGSRRRLATGTVPPPKASATS